MGSIPLLNRSGISGIGQDIGTEGTCMLHKQKLFLTALSHNPAPVGNSLPSCVPCIPDGSAQCAGTCQTSGQIVVETASCLLISIFLFLFGNKTFFFFIAVHLSLS